MQMKLDWSLWGYALLRATIQGGATGVTSSTVISSMAPDVFRIGSGKFFIMMAVLFISHGSVAFFNYLKQRGLPDIVTTTKVDSETVRKDGATTTVTVEQTKTESARTDGTPP